MMYWRRSQCLSWSWGIYIPVKKALYLPNERTDARDGLGLSWIELAKSLILGRCLNTSSVPWGTVTAASSADPTY